MENRQFVYLNSQDQLIISLNEQIKATLPLTQSYTALQRYHKKLSLEIQSLLSQKTMITQSSNTKIGQLKNLIMEYETKKNVLSQQLKKIETNKTKALLDKNNLISHNQTLINKINLQLQQTRLSQQNKRQLLENINKNDQNINTLKKIIIGIEDQIQIKNKSVYKIKQNVIQKQQCNCNLVRNINGKQNSIQKSIHNNQDILIGIKQLQLATSNIEQKIRNIQKIYKQQSDKIISKKSQLTNLYHQKQYTQKLLQNQAIDKENLIITQTKLKKNIQNLFEQIDLLKKQNNQYEGNIKMLKDNYQKSVTKLSSIKGYLNELVKSNSILLQTLKKSSKSNEKVHQILDTKLQRFNKIMIEIGYGFQNNKTIRLKDKSNQFLFFNKIRKQDYFGKNNRGEGVENLY